jgi:hypothetical protein
MSFARLLIPVEGSSFLPYRRVRDFENLCGLGFWFEEQNFQSSLIQEPIELGSEPYSASFVIRVDGLARRKVVIQCVSQSGPKFPRSLNIWLDNCCILSSLSNLRSRFVDITPLVKTSPVIEVLCDREECSYFLYLRIVEKRSFDDLLAEVLRRKLPAKDSPVCCPLTKKVMKVPVRSMKCAHGQCCELKALLESVSPGDDLVCPVCKEVILFDDLGVDYKMMEMTAGQRMNRTHACLQRQSVNREAAKGWNSWFVRR